MLVAYKLMKNPQETECEQNKEDNNQQQESPEDRKKYIAQSLDK